MILVHIRKQFAAKHPRWFVHPATNAYVWSDGVYWEIHERWESAIMHGPHGCDPLENKWWLRFLLPTFKSLTAPTKKFPAIDTWQDPVVYKKHDVNFI